SLKDCDFSWDSKFAVPPTRHLRGITLSVGRGELIGVVGRVGNGKSSLLSAIVGEMERLSGACTLNAQTIGYVPQQAWILNKKLRDNILFEKPYDDQLYNRVLDACALKPDLEMLVAGDQTEIGEKGINLSGGQKARVSLARAVYQRAELYIIDDTLSAVDSHVGKHIFENVLSNDGLLKDTTRIFATNSLRYLRHFDRVVVMRDGTIGAIGTPEQLVSSDDSTVAELFAEYAQKEASSWSLENETDSSNSSEETPKAPREATSNTEVRPTDRDETERGKLIEEEHVKLGTASSSVYVDYFKAFGAWLAVGYVVILYGGSSTLDALSNVWLAKWTSAEAAGLNDTRSSAFDLGVYGALGLLN
ncbi:multi drug resistance-associated protein, partial [Aphelenchoides avenae]